MRPIDDCSLNSDERLAEVARILAAGILRLHARAAISGISGDVANSAISTSENLSESVSSGLEVPDKTVLSGHNG